MVHKLCLLLTVGLAAAAHGQQNSSSPFSSQGMGEPGGLEDPQFGAIGNSRTAVIDSTTVNLFNPSSYAFMAAGQPLFSFGMSSHLSDYTSQGAHSSGRVIGLNQIAMVVPAGKRFGLAVGLHPFSRRGYTIQQRVLENGDSIVYNYNGSGSTQQVTGGIAVKIINRQRHQLAAGANAAYIFGSVTNERTSSFVAYDPEGGVDQATYRMHDGRYSLGLNYNVWLTNSGSKQLRIGAVYSPDQFLRAHRDYRLYSGTDVTDATTYDTILEILNDRGGITYPTEMSLGFSLVLRPEGGENYKLRSIYQVTVFGEYSRTQWSEYRANFANEKVSGIFDDAQRFSLGIQFTPNYESNKKATGSSYFNRVRYRAGTYFGTMPNMSNGTQLSEYGITAGLGLPIASQKTNSSFNFSLQYGKRGGNIPDGISERFFSVNVGVILAPSSYDKWFKKYKLD